MLIEVKDVKRLDITDQIRGYLASPEAVHIIISPKTEWVSPTIMNALDKNGGIIEIYDPVTKLFTPWKRK